MTPYEANHYFETLPEGFAPAEELRAALPDTARITATAFDVPQKDSIHAYYCNRDTEKWGKIVLFQPFSPCQGHLFKSP